MPIWFVPPYLNLAEQYYIHKDYKKALIYYDKIFKIYEQEPKCDGLLADVYMKAGYSYGQLGEYSKSNDKFLHCYSQIKESPDKTLKGYERVFYLSTYSCWIGYNYNQMGDYKNAFIYLADSIKYDPQSPDALREIGYSSIKLDKIEDAINYFGESIKLDSSKDNIEKIHKYLSGFPDVEEKIFKHK